MDFEEYVAARHSTLLRTAVLLGCPAAQAPAVVARVLAASSRRIERADDPDPTVYDALVAAIPGARGSPLATADPVTRDELVMSAPVVDVLDRHLPDVRPAPPQPPAWQLVPALAALVALVIAAALVGPGTPTAAAPEPGLLGADQVPSVFGYDSADARALLEQRGIGVAERPARACELGGRVLSTDPPVGSPVRRGAIVTLRVAVPSDPDCLAEYGDRTLVWRLVDFATGRGPAPDFAPSVRLLVVGAEPRVLTEREAADPAAWGDRSALVAIADAAQEVLREGPTYLTPRLSVSSGVPPEVTCRSSRPYFAGERTALTFRVGVRTDASQKEGAPCPTTVSVYRTGGEIDAVVLYAPPASSIQPRPASAR